LVGDVLTRETASYPRLSAGEAADIVIRMLGDKDADPTPVRAMNPSIHREYADGFRADWPYFSATWRRSPESVAVDMRVRRRFQSWYRKLRNAEFHSPEQDIGKFLHELVLVGTAQMFFSNRLLFLHGSGLTDPDGRGVVIGGTGGVGKTSLALELGRRADYRFLADDLVGVGAEGTVYYNGSWPKIYAYNTAGDRDLEQAILRGHTSANRLHWRLLKRFPSRVRRAVEPGSLFGEPSESAPLRRLYLVFRTDVADISVSFCPPTDAAILWARVCHIELGELGRHVAWSAYNRSLLGLPPLVPDWGPEAWAAKLVSRLACANCYTVRVPQGMANMEYRRHMAEVLTQAVDV